MNELEQFKTILATLCLEHDDMKLGTALLLAEEIQGRMGDLPLEGVRLFDPQYFTDTSPHADVDAWLRTQVHISSMPKINGIKEIRALTSMGLKSAKDAYERVFPLSGF